MLLKISTGKLTLKHNFPGDCTLHELQLFIEDKTGIADYASELLIGFPPTLLQHQGPTAKLASVGLKNGMLVTVRPNAEAQMLFNQLHEMGFNPSVIRQCLAIVSIYDVNTCIEICQQLTEGAAKLVRRTVPADNGCLFNAIGVLVEHDDFAPNPKKYRQMVADYIMNHAEEFPDGMLEHADYPTWIMQKDKWGGEVEVSILARLLALEIAVVDIRTGKALIYGREAGYTDRIYLLYDGVHYDALLQPQPLLPAAGPARTVFSPTDLTVLQAAEAIAQELHGRRQFVDLAGDQLRCGACQAVLRGEGEARLHATATGHQSFSQAS